MALNASVSASSTEEEMAIDHDVHGRATFQAQPAAERDRRFFQKVAHSHESVTLSLRTSVAQVAESKVLIDKINDLLRR